ncbi:unnamed protein product [Owenia fusiformis]|uniref:Alpha-galactosidase n=1 Tax=Owenia fusiformis TaxID=6347 RepID=A0A8S4N0R7_OWEFU|nr:unnamed protein product [Owenia fusiformis]
MYNKNAQKMDALHTFYHIILVISNVVHGLDWLIDDIPMQSTWSETRDGLGLLTNGLISKTFITTPDFACIDFYDNHTTFSSLQRSIEPEAVIMLDGIVYPIGGVLTNIPLAYLNRSAFAQNITRNENAFHLKSSLVTFDLTTPFPYTPRRGAPKNINWPPKGIHIEFNFTAPFWAPDFHKDLVVTVTYEMYDSVPGFSKWITVTALKPVPDIYVSFLSVEYLAVNMPWSPNGKGWLFVETDQPHGTNVVWGSDPASVSMPGSFEQTVNCTYETDHPVAVPIVNSLSSFKVHELVIASSDPERIALSKHRLFRLLAPHTQENPIFFHMTNQSSEAFRTVIDQMAEVGFEMLIYSFGSGFNIESEDEAYIKRMAADIRYANSKNIEVGGYDLIALTRRTAVDWMAIDPSTMQPSGNACFASDWYDFLLKRMMTFMDRTNLSMVETDGPYGGYPCASTNHSHHTDLGDSIYKQNTLQAQFYTTLRKRSIYINQPDYYFYSGGSRTGMGYNENQYSLPRWQDISVSRQGMYDDTYQRIPTAGWMFVPLVDYHGGGEAAAFEPLTEHIVEYEWALAQYLGAGVAACYRGYRLYDSLETKALVTKWVSFYKKYRDILISDIVHVRRADMQGIDSFMHVNPKLDYKGLAMVFNPTQTSIDMNLKLPLYYTGIPDKAMVREQEGQFIEYDLDRGYNIEVPVHLKPLGITWFLIQQSVD